MTVALGAIGFGAGYAATPAKTTVTYRTPSACVRALDHAAEAFARVEAVVRSNLDISLIDSFNYWVDQTSYSTRADNETCRAAK